jgi:hypothetical protein
MRSAVERLVRDRLGCSCPEAVFARIGLDYRGGSPPEVDLRIGGRLLVHLRRPGAAPDAEAALPEWLARGRDTRDAEGLNRFRLVLGLAADSADVERLQARFRTLSGGDRRLHLHLLPPDELDEVLGG